MVDVVELADEGLGNSSWLVDLGEGSALVVDPRRDPRSYLEAARARRLRIRFAAETHLHADFVSGAGELAKAVGAHVVASAGAQLAIGHRPVGEGDEVDLGGLTLRVVATPVTAPSTSPTCWPTVTGRSSCSPAGP